MSNVSLCVLACWFFSGEKGRSSSASCGHFQCLILENFMFRQCSLLIGSASSLEYNQSGCGVVHLGCARSIFWMLCDDQKVLADTWLLLRVANSRSLSPVLFVSSLLKGPKMPCQFPQACLPTFAFQSTGTTRIRPSSVSDQWHSVAGHRILLFCCHHSLTLGCTLVLLWCWKGLPSDGW